MWGRNRHRRSAARTFATAAVTFALIFWPALDGPAHAAPTRPDPGTVLVKHQPDHHGLPAALLHRLRQHATQQIPPPVTAAVIAARISHRLLPLGTARVAGPGIPGDPSDSHVQSRAPPTAS